MPRPAVVPAGLASLAGLDGSVPTVAGTVRLSWQRRRARPSRAAGVLVTGPETLAPPPGSSA